MPFDPLFLEVPIRVPETSDPDAPLLDYQHFSVRMNRARRLAWWVAWNIDGRRLFPEIGRAGQRFRLDDRLPADEQTGEAVYADNPLDRGHIARRADLLWGTLSEAKAANRDSFYFTNITPQMADFNQSGRGGVWGELENGVLEFDGLADRRVSLFAGPVLADDDPLYRDLVHLPRDHWKVVIYRLEDRLRVRAFVLRQDLEPLPETRFLDRFRTYQVAIDDLAARTGLVFPGLDALTAASAGPHRAGPRLLESVEDVSW